MINSFHANSRLADYLVRFLLIVCYYMYFVMSTDHIRNHRKALKYKLIDLTVTCSYITVHYCIRLLSHELNAGREL